MPLTSPVHTTPRDVSGECFTFEANTGDAVDAIATRAPDRHCAAAAFIGFRYWRNLLLCNILQALGINCYSDPGNLNMSS